MISAVICSRNDDYGVNLPLRTLHSLNAWGMALSLSDELIFIDDNTDPGKPPLVELVWGYLIPRVRSIIRVLVVTPEVHQSFGVSIPVAENHCRNIGIRRARGDWIISTTNDNIVLDLYPVVMELPPAVYVAQPREANFWSNYASTYELIHRLHALDWESTTHHLSYEKRWLVHAKGGDCLVAPKFILEEVRGFEEGMKDFGHGESNVLRKAMARAYKLDSISHRGVKVFHESHCPNPHSGSHFLDGTKLNDFDYWCQNFWRTENPETWGEWPVVEWKP